MTVFAFVNAEGLPTGGGRVPVGVALPDGALALPDGRDVGDLGRLRWTGSEWVTRPEVVAVPPTEDELAARAATLLLQARDEALTRVNAAVSAVRKLIYTDIPGQDALYLEKRAEAVAFVREVGLTGEPATMDAYPLLANEVGITAPDAWQLAQIWLHRSDQFKALGAATESARMRATVAIASAPDYAALDQIVAEFQQSLQSLKP